MKLYDPEYPTWLESLQVGDKVAECTSHYGDVSYSISTIEKITKTGQIKVTGNDSKYKNGKEMGNSGSWSIDRYIVPVTDEVRENVERMRLLYFIEKTQFKNVETEKLRKIEAVLKGE
jgi:hypothetical protein